MGNNSNYRLYKDVLVNNCNIGNYTTVGDDSVVVNTTLGNYVEIDRRNYIHNSMIGDFTYTGMNTYIGMCEIGKYCSISRGVDMGGVDHNYCAVTTYPDEKMIRKIMKQNFEIDTSEKIIIGNDVWIGQGVTIIKKHGIKIGNGAVIGAGSLVTKDVPDYAIVVGTPARIMKYRFEPGIIEELQKIEWWDFPLDVIKDKWKLLSANMDNNTITELWKIKEEL